jgi:hypothetical protein
MLDRREGLPFRFKQTNTCNADGYKWSVKKCVRKPVGRTTDGTSTAVASKSQMRPCRPEITLADGENHDRARIVSNVTPPVSKAGVQDHVCLHHDSAGGASR